MAEDPKRHSVNELVERSSLGSPAAVAARATVTDEQAAAIVARAKEIESMSNILSTSHQITVTVHLDPPMTYENRGRQVAITHVTVTFGQYGAPSIKPTTAVIKKDGTVGTASGGWLYLRSLDQLREDIRDLVLAGYAKAVAAIPSVLS